MTDSDPAFEKKVLLDVVEQMKDAFLRQPFTTPSLSPLLGASLSNHAA